MTTRSFFKTLSFFLMAATIALVSCEQEPENPPSGGEGGGEPGNKKLVFIHHSTGGNLLADNYGELGKKLNNAGFYVSDICYGWSAPENAGQGDNTDIGQWYSWFADETVQANNIKKRDNIMNAVYTNYSWSGQYGSYTRGADPGGENEIVMIKSCFPNSHVNVANSSTPAQFYNQVFSSPNHNVSNIKALYNAILPYMKSHSDKMFVIIANPSLLPTSTNNDEAARAREVTNWLTLSWLKDNNWENKNVYVWNYFNVLTDEDNHHWVVDGNVVHHTASGSANTTAYSNNGDDHPSVTAAKKGATELSQCITVWYNTWRNWLSTNN